MDKGKQPNIWGRHNLNQLAEEAFRRNKEKERAQVVGEILDYPDGCEEGNINPFSGNVLSRLSNALEKALDVSLSPGACGTVSVKLFNPHERVVDNSLVVPMEVNTSVVALDAYGPGSVGRDGSKVGSILLFKVAGNLIKEPAPGITAKDLAWGENCVFGAFVDGDAINYFEIGQTSGDVVQAELRRNDPMEENGQSVEMRVVKPGQDQLIVQKLPSSSDEVFELEQELDKFMASRSAQ